MPSFLLTIHSIVVSLGSVQQSASVSCHTWISALRAIHVLYLSCYKALRCSDERPARHKSVSFAVEMTLRMMPHGVEEECLAQKQFHVMIGPVLCRKGL